MTTSLLNDADQVVHTAWQHYAEASEDQRQIATLEEVSAHVSTNRVFHVVFDDKSTLVAKVSSYGSYFLFAETTTDSPAVRPCCATRVGPAFLPTC